jgi:hypothetical protein
MSASSEWKAALRGDSRRPDSPGYSRTLMLQEPLDEPRSWLYYNWPGLVLIGSAVVPMVFVCWALLK